MDSGRERGERGGLDLVRRLAERVEDRVQQRGEVLFGLGAVELGVANANQVTAVVYGGEPYDVTIARDGRGLALGCSCPGFAKFGPCKHLWAAALEFAEQLEGGSAGGASWGPGEPPAAVARLRSLAVEAASDGAEVWDPFAPQSRRPFELRYVVELRRSDRLEGLALEYRRVNLRKDGSVGQQSPYDPLAYNAVPLPDPVDRRLVALIGGARDEYASPYGYPGGGAHPVLPPALAEVVLPELAATGRLHWSEPGREGGPLALDPGEPYEPRARVLVRGERRVLEVHLERAVESSGAGAGGVERLGLDQPLALFGFGWLVLPGRVARFDAGGAAPLLRDLRVHGPLEFGADEERRVLVELAGTPGLGAGLVETLGPVELGLPLPRLYVETGGRRRRSTLGCTVELDYGGERVEPSDPRELLALEGGARVVRRDRELERQAVARFLELGGRPGAANRWHEGPAAVDAGRFSAMVRGLLADGWLVEADDLRWRLAGSTSVSVSSGVDWFELRGAVQFGDQTASLPELLAAARAGRDTVRLGDGSIGILPERWLERWRMLALAEQGEGGGLRFRSNQAFLIDALLAEREEALEVDAGFRKLRQRLADFERVEPVSEPEGFVGELRPYQREGLGWLGFLEQLDLGGCLADDMGLGKTVQVLAFLQARRARRAPPGGRRPSLVVAPRSLVFNWIDEAARFVPGLSICDYTGPKRSRLRSKLARHDLVVTTYGTLRSDADFFSKLELECAVLDESQAIKNSASQTAKAARLLHARQRIALSGTPIENHLGELWSLFEFLNPGMLGSARVFSDLVGRDPTPAGVDGAQAPVEAAERGALARAMRPFFLRRRKEEVLDDLPPKTEQTLHCTMEGPERRRYDELRRHYRDALLAREEEVGLARMKIQVLEALLRLRQAALHPGLLDPARDAEPSAKLDVLLPRLEQVAETGKKALVFSQFTRLLSIVRARLDQAGIPYEYLDGRTRNRKEKVERFQNEPTLPLFLISLKAGGHGLNLTAADYVFLLDPWWNPAVEAQAVDRAHRIGRTRPVVAYRLIAEDTIEERVLELQASKRALAEALFDEGAGGLKGLTRTDLERLFAG